ncbi:MAG: 50S ribosomal protein L1 [Candidatus Hydrogenedentes bacterium]|nr:50S ribosomal protein L1 [Candidatus Hydrogenedentota bacterium]
MAKMSKRSRAIRVNHDHERTYSLTEAAQGVKKTATAKFDETIELAFYLGVDPRHADQQVRGSVSLPHGTGKKIRVVVFCKQLEQVNAAMEAGAIEAGSDELITKISGGWLDFDAAVAAPDMMGQVGRLGKVLGPRGLMPSPKAGTVTPNVAQAVAEILKGKIEYRVDKNANIHVPVAKASFSAEQIEENAASVIGAVVKARPAACKGTYLKSCTMSSTMGPGYRLDAASLSAQFK